MFIDISGKPFEQWDETKQSAARKERYVIFMPQLTKRFNDTLFIELYLTERCNQVATVWSMQEDYCIVSFHPKTVETLGALHERIRIRKRLFA